MFQETKFAFRMLLKSPGFTIVALATLALAIGANTAVFSLLNALLLRPLPHRAPQHLVLLWEQFSKQGLDRIPVSAPEFIDYEKQARSFNGIAAFNYESFNLALGDMPERIQGAVVSPGLFTLLGVDPLRGRGFQPNEVGLGHDDVVVISERLWKRRFNSDPAMLGGKLILNGRTYTVIGVMPASFEFPLPLFNVQGGQFAERADIWKPVAFTEDEMKSRGARSYGVIARLAPGVSRLQAQAELDTMIASWKTQFKDNYGFDTGFGARLYGLQDQVVGGMRPALFILFGAVVLVLLIACANLTTMLLARGGVREREMAIRVALGAGPWRLLRQMLTESVVLAVLGAAAGILLAIWGLDLLGSIGAKTIPRLREVNVDTTVLLLTVSVAVLTGLLFGIAPALASAKPELTESLKEGGRGSTAGRRRNRLRNGLVVAEVSLALVLLIGAGLLMKSFVRLQNVSPGFNPHNVLTMEVALPVVKYPRGQPVIDFYAETQRRMERLPGVEGAAFTSILPLSGSNSDNSFTIEGRPLQPTGPFPDEELRIITPDYFKVLQIPLVEGRSFTGADTGEAPKVVIINQALARKYWPEGGALGQRISFDDRNPDWITIVGVAGDIRHRGLDTDPVPELYFPHSFRAYREMIMVVRSSQDPRSLIGGIRREMLAFDPEQPVANVRTLDEVISDSVAPRRLSVTLLGVFAAIALILASVGIYGVMSYLVVQRTHEIGVRMALGAQRGDVLRLVVGHGLRLLLAGTAIGLVLAFACTRALGTLLYRVESFDPVTFAGISVILAAVALLASYIPARRATRSDPMVALTHNT